MRNALRIGCGILIGSIMLRLRRRRTKKRAVSLDMGREEAFKKAQAAIDATDPAVHRPFIDGQNI